MREKGAERNKGRKKVLALALCMALMTACFGGFAAGVNYQDTSVYADETAELTVSQITAKVANSVVEIRTESVTTGSYMQQYIEEGAGSGVIISSDGYIVTNNHVIDGAGKITVTLRSGTSYTATLKGTDETTDLALLKITATGLSAATLGTSSNLEVGETAVVIGNPLGQLGGTVTAGIISALERQINIEGRTMTLLQTDAAVNPGNSGGGLFDGQGQLVGIVAAKSSGSDVEGLGFAIPVDSAEPVIESLMDKGYVSGRVTMGLTLTNSTSMFSQMSRYFYGSFASGVYISGVTSGSNAAKAGIKAGDSLYAIDGKSVSSTTDVTSILQGHAVGDTLKLGISRNGKRYTVNLTLEEYQP